MQPDNVLALTPETFSDHVGGKYPAFVEFYAPWCGHCKSLAPEWAVLSETFSPRDGVVIAKVDADAHSSLAGKFGVTGFPTIKWFPAGSTTPSDYSGGRTADDLVAHVNKEIGTHKKVKKAPSAVHDLDDTNFDATVDSSKHTLVEFFAPWCGHCKQLAPAYEKLGAAFESEPNVVIAKVDADKHRELGTRFGVSGFPTLKYFPPGPGSPEERAVDHTAGRDLPSLVEFMNEKAGTFRDVNGGLSPAAGRLDTFDALALHFVTDGADQESVVAAAVKAAAELAPADAEKAAVYVNLMKRSIEKGAGWLQKEAARVEGMMASSSVSKAKKADLAVKRNVMSAFKAASPAAAAVAGDEAEL